MAKTSHSKGPHVTKIDSCSLAQLSVRLKAYRKSQGLTLQALADISGISRAGLSKIERSEMSPSLETINKIALGLGLSTLDLLGNDVEETFNGYEVTRAVNRLQYSTPNYDHQLLAEKSDKKAMSAFLSTVKATDISDYEHYDCHDSEDFVYVVRGRVRVYLKDDQFVDLGTGDTLYIGAQTPHAFVSLSSNSEHGVEASDAVEAQILWVGVPKAM